MRCYLFQSLHETRSDSLKERKAVFLKRQNLIFPLVAGNIWSFFCFKLNKFAIKRKRCHACNTGVKDLEFIGNGKPYYKWLIYVLICQFFSKFQSWNNMKSKVIHLPIDTRRKLNAHKTFRRRSGRLLNVLCTFNLCLVSAGLFHVHSQWKPSFKEVITLSNPPFLQAI